MSMLKLVVYGGIGYLIYQMFFADMPASNRQPRGGQSSEDAAENQGLGRGNLITDKSSRGLEVETQDARGTGVRHKVGRGVISR